MKHFHFIPLVLLFATFSCSLCGVEGCSTEVPTAVQEQAEGQSSTAISYNKENNITDQNDGINSTGSTNTSSPVTQDIVPTPFKCIVPYGALQDPIDCTYFYVCIDNNGYRLQCLPGYAFDPVKGYCNEKSQVASCALTNILYGFQCPSGDGFFPDKLDCTKYYWCYNKAATQLTCELGMRFDKNYKMCLPSNYATCASILDP